MYVETPREIQAKAVARFGPAAKIFPFHVRDAGQRLDWWGVAVGRVIIGARRELSQLPDLIQRGPVMQCLASPKNSRPDTAADTPSV